MQDLTSTLDHLDALLEKFQFEEALKLCQDALLKDQNADLYCHQGNILIELGKFEEAQDSFLVSLSLNPNLPEVLMNLGQLSEGSASLAYYERGIELLRNGSVDEAERESRALKLSGALCCLAELYMTDCCEEEGADVKCEACIQEALQLAPQNPDVLVTAASFQLTKGNQEEALRLLSQLHHLVSQEDPSCPSIWDASFETRLNAVRLMVEAGSPFSQLLDLLNKLEKDDEECVDVYYLYALVYFQSKEYGQCIEALEDAKVLMEKLQLPDEEMRVAISQLEEQARADSSETTVGSHKEDMEMTVESQDEESEISAESQEEEE